jgi:hypothetical protein
VTEGWTLVSAADVECPRIIYTWPPCRVYWGSHGCSHPRGHSADVPHECDCCACVSHPDEDSGCVARPPYYGEGTRFYGEDAEALGLPLVGGTEDAR